jgi:hypothetical protein
VSFPVAYLLSVFWGLEWARFAEQTRREDAARAEERNRAEPAAPSARRKPRARRARRNDAADLIGSKPKAKPETTRRDGRNGVKPNGSGLHPLS